MGLMDVLRGRSGKATAQRRTEPPVCDHRSLLPRWNRAEDMGRDDLATSYQCEACNQVFGVEEARRLREEASRRLHDAL